MRFLGRRVSLPRWEKKYATAPADALTQDLQTRRDELSLWEFPASCGSIAEEVTLAVACRRDHIEASDAAWISDDELASIGVELKPTDGPTFVPDLRASHRDVVDLDASAIVKIADCFEVAILVKGQCKRLSKLEVTEVLVKAVQSGRLKLEDLQGKTREDIATNLRATSSSSGKGSPASPRT